jgi:hypothetical protein
MDEVQQSAGSSFEGGIKMRLAKASAVAGAAALLISAMTALPAAQQDADKKVAGGGVTVKGWQGRVDSGNRQSLTINDSKFAPEGSSWRLTTGAAGLYWSPANMGKGDFSVKATFTEPKQPYNHPHPYGVFIGGKGLDTETPQALYCVAYRNGNYIVRGFSGGKVFPVVGKPTPNDAVKKAEGPEAQVVQDVAMSVRGDKVECTVNGTSVWSAAKADVTGAGKLASTDGIAGIRVNHQLEVHVDDFAVTK